MVEALRAVCGAPIISLRRSAADQPLAGAHFDIDPDPEELLKVIAEVVQASASET